MTRVWWRVSVLCGKGWACRNKYWYSDHHSVFPPPIRQPCSFSKFTELMSHPLFNYSISYSSHTFFCRWPTSHLISTVLITAIFAAPTIRHTTSGIANHLCTAILVIIDILCDDLQKFDPRTWPWKAWPYSCTIHISIPNGCGPESPLLYYWKRIKKLENMFWITPYHN